MTRPREFGVHRREVLTNVAASAVFAAAAGFFSRSASAAVTQQPAMLDVTLEGRIEDREIALVSHSGGLQTVQFHVMGKEVHFPYKQLDPFIPEFFSYPITETGDLFPAAGAPPRPTMPCRIRLATSPVGFLTPKDLINTSSFLGRDSVGFQGSQVTVSGFFDLRAPNRILAYGIDIFPEETVIVGPLTGNAEVPGGVTVCGVPVQLQTDSRLIPDSVLPGQLKYLNDHYLPMKISSARLPQAAPTGMVGGELPGNTAVEGYFAKGVFYASRFVAGNAGELIDGAPARQISVDRVRIRDLGNGSFQIEARGGLAWSGLLPGATPPSVRIYRIDIDEVGNRRDRVLIANVADIRIDANGMALWRIQKGPFSASSNSPGWLRTPPERVMIEMSGPAGEPPVSIECGTDWRPA